MDTYRLGYVKEESFEQMHIKRQALRFVEASMEHAQECKSCSYYQLCRGGCKRHREMAEEDPNYFCKAYSMFFERALERMIRLSRYY